MSITERFRIAITATPATPRKAPLLLYGNLADAFQHAADHACQGVEIHMRRAEDVDVTLVKRLAAQYRMGIPTLGTGMAAGDGLSFTHPNPEVRTLTVERVRGHIEVAAEVGAAVTIGILSGRLGDGDAEERLRRRQNALQCLSEVCAIARPYGVTVLLEPLNRYECDYINRLSDGVAIATEIGASNLKLLADTFHMNIEEADIPASLRAAGQWIGHVHLADTNREAPGHGHLDVAAVLGALAGIGYQGYLSFEVHPVPNALDAIRDGVAAVHAAEAAGVL